MLVLYVVVLVLLALVQFALRWRVGRLERRFIKVAAQADALLKQSAVRGGNNRADPFVALRHNYQLTQLALKRDRVEGRYAAWQAFSEGFARFRGRLSGFKGKALPYLIGALDVAAVVAALDHYGVGVEQVKALLGLTA